MTQLIDVWTDGTTGGFNVRVNSNPPTYCPNYQAAWDFLHGLGVTAEMARELLQNAVDAAARRKAQAAAKSSS